MSSDVVIVYAPVGGGHKAAALALAEAAGARGLTAKVLDLFAYAPPIVGATYQAAHVQGTTLTPNLYGVGYFAANRRDGALEPLRRGFDHVAFAGLVKQVRLENPHSVVATHHLPLVVLGRARRLGRLSAPLTGVVTDYTAHACWAEKGVDAFAVPCGAAARELWGHGIPRADIEETGIPVRRAFEEVPDLVAPRAGEPLRVLVTSGSFGLGPLTAIVRSFKDVRDVELTVVCGTSREAAARATRAAAEAGVRASVLGFEHQMPRRLAEAHVVIGKAGGLTVSEAMAAGRPMILVGTVPGNELSNERLVVCRGAGYGARPADAGALADAMRTRGVLEEMGRQARGAVLAHAADRALDVALRAGRRAAFGRPGQAA